MSSKLKTLIEHFLSSSIDEPCLIYDDSNVETKVTQKELKISVDKIVKELENVFEDKSEPKTFDQNHKITKEVEVSEENTKSSIIGIAFNANSKSVLSFLPSIFAAILNQVII